MAGIKQYDTNELKPLYSLQGCNCSLSISSHAKAAYPNYGSWVLLHDCNEVLLQASQNYYHAAGERDEKMQVQALDRNQTA